MTDLSDPAVSSAVPGAPATMPDGTAEFSFLDMAVLLTANLKLLVLAPFCAGLLGLGCSYLIKPIFTSTTTIMVPQQQQSMATALLGQLSGLAGGVAGGAAASLAGIKNPADQWVGLLKSVTIADALLDQFKLVERYERDFRFEARKALEDRTTITAGKDGLISIAVDDPDPATAAKLAEAYTTELQKLSSSMALTEAAQRRVFFEQRLLEAKDNLVKAEVAVQRSGVGMGAIKTQPEAAVEALAKLRAQVVALEVRLPVMRGYLAENSIEMQQAQTELSALRRQLSKAEEDAPAGAGGVDYVARYRDFKYYETLYELMARQYEIARVDEARDGTLIQVVDHAQVPEWKSKPKRALLALGTAFAALLVALLFVLSRNAVRNIKRDAVHASKWATLVSQLGLGGRRS